MVVHLLLLKFSMTYLKKLSIDPESRDELSLKKKASSTSQKTRSSQRHPEVDQAQVVPFSNVDVYYDVTHDVNDDDDDVIQSRTTLQKPPNPHQPFPYTTSPKHFRAKKSFVANFQKAEIDFPPGRHHRHLAYLYKTT